MTLIREEIAKIAEITKIAEIERQKSHHGGTETRRRSGIGKNKTLPRIYANKRGSGRQKSEPQRTQRNTEAAMWIQLLASKYR